MDVVRKSKQADRVVLANGSDPQDWKQDPHFIEGARIEKDMLHLSVSYTGGCAEHDFRLVAWDYFTTVKALQAELLLAHNANGDACKAIVKEALRFDISPLKAQYHRAYDGEPGIVLLCLHNLRIQYYV